MSQDEKRSKTQEKQHIYLSRRSILLSGSLSLALATTIALPTHAETNKSAPQTEISQNADPLPSWNDGAAKSAIVDFVTRVTKEGGPDDVKPEERIAVFDNDGTLWAEHPYYFQLAFAIDRIAELAPQHPEWKDKQPFKGIIERGSFEARMLCGCGPPVVWQASMAKRART